MTEPALSAEDERRLVMPFVELQAENQRLRLALKQAQACCARPAGVCFDPALIDGGEIGD